eukprot:g79899.t1
MTAKYVKACIRPIFTKLAIALDSALSPSVMYTNDQSNDFENNNAENTAGELAEGLEGLALENDRANQNDVMNNDQNSPEEEEDQGKFTGHDQRRKDGKMAEIQRLVASLAPANTAAERQSAVESLRRLLSVTGEQQPIVQQVIDANALPRLIALLDDWDHPNIQLEAAWSLTNITSSISQHCVATVNEGVVPSLVRLMTSTSPEVVEQAIWCMGNIAGDSPRMRDTLLGENIIPSLMTILSYHLSPGARDAFAFGRFTSSGETIHPREEIDPKDPFDAKSSIEPGLGFGLRQSEVKITLIRTTTWLISNLCRGKPEPPEEAVAPLGPLLCELLTTSIDNEVQMDAAWGLAYLTDRKVRLTDVQLRSLGQGLIRMMRSHERNTIVPALRTVGNILSSTDLHTQIMVDTGVIPLLRELLQNPHNNIRKEAAWALSNITAGTRQQIQAVIDEGCIPHLIEMLNSDNYSVYKEVAWVISNLSSGGSRQQISFLVQQGLIPRLVESLRRRDERDAVLPILLEAITNIARTLWEQDADVLLPLLPVLEDLADAPDGPTYDKLQSAISAIQQKTSLADKDREDQPEQQGQQDSHGGGLPTDFAEQQPTPVSGLGGGGDLQMGLFSDNPVDPHAANYH